MILMFFCESALEEQRAGRRAAANKSKNKTIGPLLRARRATADARGGGMEEGGGRGAMRIIQRFIEHIFTGDL